MTSRRHGVLLGAAAVAFSMFQTTDVSANPDGATSLWAQRAYNAARIGRLDGDQAKLSFPRIVSRLFLGGQSERGAAHVGDLDGDGTLEEVGLDGGTVTALSRDLTVLWTSDNIDAQQILALADLDDDGASEVLVAAPGEAIVLGGADGAVLFSFEYEGGGLQISNIDGDDALEVLVRDEGMRAYDFSGGADQGQLAWQVIEGLPDGPFDFAVGDSNDDLNFEVLIDDRDGGRIIILNADTGALTLHSDVRAIEGDGGCGPSTLAQLDTDTQSEVIVSGAASDTDSSAFLAVYDAVEDDFQWSYEYGNGDRGTAVMLLDAPAFDIDGDGQAEVIASIFNNTAEVTDGEREDLDGIVQPGVWTLAIYDGATGDTVAFTANRIAVGVADLDGDGTVEILAQQVAASIDPTDRSGALEALGLTEDGLERAWSLPNATLMGVERIISSTCNTDDALPIPAIADMNGDGVMDVLVERHLDTTGGPEALQVIQAAGGRPQVAGQYNLKAHHRPALVHVGLGMLDGDAPHVALRLGDGFLTVFNGGLEVASRFQLGRFEATPRVLQGFLNEDEPVRRVVVSDRKGDVRFLGFEPSVLDPTLTNIRETDGIEQPNIGVLVDGSSFSLHFDRDNSGDPRVSAVNIEGDVVWDRVFEGAPTFPRAIMAHAFDEDNAQEIAWIFSDDQGDLFVEVVSGADGTSVYSFPMSTLRLDGAEAELLVANPRSEDTKNLLIVDGTQSMQIFTLGTDIRIRTDLGTASRHNVVGDFDGDGEDELFVNGVEGRKAVFNMDVEGALVWEFPFEGNDHTYAGGPQGFPGTAFAGGTEGLDIAIAGTTGDVTMHDGGTGDVLWRVCLSNGEAEAMPTDEAPRVGACEGGRLSDITAGNLIGEDLEQDPYEFAVGGEDGWLYVLNTEDGSLEWALNLFAPVGAPLFTDATDTGALTLLVPVANGDVYSIDGAFPPVPEVRDVAVDGGQLGDTATDIDTLQALGGLGVAWDPVPNAEGYKVALLSTDGQIAMPLTDVQANTDLLIDDVLLQIGSSYTAIVVSYNEDRLQSDPVLSDGVALIDETAPEIINLASDTSAFNPLRDPAANITGSATDNLGLERVTIEARLMGQPMPVMVATLDAEGALAFDINTVWDGLAGEDQAVPDGLYTVVATATDLGDNSTSAQVEITIDATAPVAPVLNQFETPSSNNQPTFSGAAEPDSEVVVTITDGGTCETIADGDGAFTCALQSALEDGAYEATATASDTLANISLPSEAINFEIDTEAPKSPVITSPSNGDVLSMAPAEVVGNVEDDAQVRVELVDGTLLCEAVATDGTFSCAPDAAILVKGEHTIQAIATDLVGLVSDPSAPVTITIEEDTPDPNPEPNPDADPNPDTNNPDVSVGGGGGGCGCSTPSSPAAPTWPVVLTLVLVAGLVVRRR